MAGARVHEQSRPPLKAIKVGVGVYKKVFEIRGKLFFIIFATNRILPVQHTTAVHQVPAPRQGTNTIQPFFAAIDGPVN